MKRDYPDRPIVGVGAVIINHRRDRVVVVLRGSEPLKGEWSLPGGAVEVGELLADAVKREALEETGLEVEPAEIVGVFDRITRDSQGKAQYHFVLIDYVCRVTGGELRAGSDVDEVRWATVDELKPLRIAELTRGVIEKALRRSATT